MLEQSHGNKVKSGVLWRAGSEVAWRRGHFWKRIQLWRPRQHVSPVLTCPWETRTHLYMSPVLTRPWEAQTHHCHRAALGTGSLWLEASSPSPALSGCVTWGRLFDFSGHQAY